jgi:hypothetical protein
MNCHETRERLSDLLDEALPAPELAEVRAHLDGCPECRRELDQLRATVTLLSRVERPRAPVGFVDRVTAAAHPVPWYQRLGRRIFFPLNIKLPAQAAAMLLVAVLGVYLLQRTPELRDAARPERETSQRNAEPSGATSPAPTPSRPQVPEQRDQRERQDQPQDQKVLKAGKDDVGKLSEQVPRSAGEKQNTERDARRLDSPPASPPATQEPKQTAQEMKQEFKKEADRLEKPGAPAPQAAPGARVTESVAPAPAAPPAETRMKSRDAAEGQSGAMAAKRQAAMPGVLGRLSVKNRPAGEQGVADLLSRVGGIETGRRQEIGATVIEVLVPVARYPDFLTGLTTLGAFTSESQPVALPTEPPQFRLSIRITE